MEGLAPGGPRQKLADILPLRTPLLVQFFPVYACNFRCEYCFMSVPLENRKFWTRTPIMDFDLFQKCINDMTKFKDKVGTVRFVGMGEPLLHKHIVGMVHYTKTKRVTKRIEILTNGAFLTSTMSDGLVNAGLDRLIVSLQGITAEKYRKVARTNIDFPELVRNIKYFYEHRGNSHLYVKIVDYALTKQEESRFYEMFEKICDSIAVEHVVPIMPGVNYKSIHTGKSTQFGLPTPDIRVCPQPFFHMQVNPDGLVVPCYQIVIPGVMGDVNLQSLTSIWSGKHFTEFRRSMLDGRDRVCPVCESCNFVKYRQFPEDNLDEHAERLKEFY